MRTLTLQERLEAYARSDYYPYHMPGHKRRTTPFSRTDITEIEGFDNLHAPEGLLRRAQERMAALYGADRCYYSVNGSTAGLLTAISAAVPEGGRLLMARNCHRAVYHGAYLRRLKTSYIYPGTLPPLQLAAAVTPGQVERALEEHPDAEAVLITSPTYDGIVSDVGAIAELVHQKGLPLIVDAAHGAHFGLHPDFPESPVRLGADLTVVSLHKTMPCLTQTALLLERGGRIDPERLRLFESIYQTSSPSYLLMASMDDCCAAVEEKGVCLWRNFFRDREEFLERCRGLKRLRVLTAGTYPGPEEVQNSGFSDFLMDPGKILIETSKMCLTGRQFYDILLERYHLQMEMAAGDSVTAIMTCCDTREGWTRLADALWELDGQPFGGIQKKAELSYASPRLEAAATLSEALDAPKERRALSEAVGSISGGFINLYPPGIPIVAPGERISREAADMIRRYERQNLPLQGVEDGAITILKRCKGETR
ncbi:MAG: PLP-dependent transferase [Eubacteriales bacterium]|nr:PLP-dependent transferase [Eubacteriales bacterium]